MIDEPFLSYPRDVRPVVESIAKDLRDGGLSPYFDEQLSGGQAWWEELLNRIDVCDAFIPILCQQYLDSYPCRLEAEYASRLKKHFLPIALEQLTPRFFIPAIAEAQWVTYKQGDRDSLLSLLRSLRNSAGSPDPPIPPPPRPSVPVTYLTGIRDTIVSTDELSRSQQFAVLAELKALEDGLKPRIFSHYSCNSGDGRISTSWS